MFVRTVFRPFEEADQNPATQQYLDLFEAQGGEVAQRGVQALSAWLLSATNVLDVYLGQGHAPPTSGSLVGSTQARLTGP